MTAPARTWGTAAAAALAVLALALAWLSAPGQAAPGDPTAHASATSTVTIANFAFKPPALTVARGSKVRFANDSGTTHTGTRKSFDTGRIAPGESSDAIRFNRKGTFAYHCKIHPFMKGKIVVD